MLDEPAAERGFEDDEEGARHRGEVGLHRLDRRYPRAAALLQVIPGAQGPGRAGAGDEGCQIQIRFRFAEILEDPLERLSGAQIVDQIVTELRELIEDDVRLVARQFPALVVDLFDVALGAGCTHDVVRVHDPALKPFEALLAHALGQYRDPMTAQDA